LDQARLVLMALADDIGRTARRHGKKGNTVQITLKYSDFQICTRQSTIPATSTTQAICQAGIHLLEHNWDPSRPVRLIGISLSGFSSQEAPVQTSLFDQPGCHPGEDKKKELIDQAMDRIRGRHGDDSVGIASLLEKKPKNTRIQKP
jgi:DNA polymerase-4